MFHVVELQSTKAVMAGMDCFYIQLPLYCFKDCYLRIMNEFIYRFKYHKYLWPLNFSSIVENHVL
jgi:hypothetical protein